MTSTPMETVFKFQNLYDSKKHWNNNKNLTFEEHK